MPTNTARQKVEYLTDHVSGSLGERPITTLVVTESEERPMGAWLRYSLLIVPALLPVLAFIAWRLATLAPGETASPSIVGYATLGWVPIWMGIWWSWMQRSYPGRTMAVTEESARFVNLDGMGATESVDSEIPIDDIAITEPDHGWRRITGTGTSLWVAKNWYDAAVKTAGDEMPQQLAA